MKKLLLLAAVCAFSAVFAEVLWEAKSVRDFENSRPLKIQTDGSFLVTRRAWVVGKKLIPADPAKRYRVSFEVKAVTDKAAAEKVRVGVSTRDARKRNAGVSGVKPVAGTETEIVVQANKGDRVIKVKDASKWVKSTASIIVFDADPTGQMRDIPNFDFISSRPAAWEKKGDVWEITLNRPLRSGLAAGIIIRQHFAGRAAIFSSNKKISREWKSLEFILGPGISEKGASLNQLFPGVAFIAPMIMASPDMLIRNCKIEVMK